VCVCVFVSVCVYAKDLGGQGEDGKRGGGAGKDGGGVDLSRRNAFVVG
jgi:hypothetical protein